MRLGQIAEFIALGVTFIVIVGLAILYLPKQREIVYNCSIAEISPDFPVEVREQCRKLNTREIK